MGVAVFDDSKVALMVGANSAPVFFEPAGDCVYVTTRVFRWSSSASISAMMCIVASTLRSCGCGGSAKIPRFAGTSSRRMDSGEKRTSPQYIVGLSRGLTVVEIIRLTVAAASTRAVDGKLTPSYVETVTPDHMLEARLASVNPKISIGECVTVLVERDSLTDYEWMPSSRQRRI